MNLRPGDYILLERPGRGLLTTEHPRYGRQVWSRSRLRRHRNSPCAQCRREPLGEQAYRPIGNGMNRMERICERCAEQAPGGGHT